MVTDESLRAQVDRLDRQLFAFTDESHEDDDDLADNLRDELSSPDIDLSTLSDTLLIDPRITGASATNTTLYNTLLTNTTLFGTATVTESLLLQSANPTITTDRLYNFGGDLYWNGSIVTSSTTANWSGSGGDVYRLSGNVGLGTSTPATRLSVVGDTTLTGALTTSGAVRLSALTDGLLSADSSGTLNTLATSSLGLGDGTFLGLSDTPSVYTAGSILFTSGSGVASDTDQFFWDNTNNRLGIGSSTPSAKLTVDYLDGTDTGPRFRVGSSTATDLIVDANGNVGIGTSNISGALHVLRDTSYELNLESFTNGGSGIEISGRRYRGNVASPLPLQEGDTVLRLSALAARDDSVACHSSRIRFATDGDGSGSSVPGRIVFETSNAGTNCGSNVEHMRLTSSGNLGIGTTSPSSRLTVQGNGYFGGDLTATGTLALLGTGTSTTAGNWDIAGDLALGGALFDRLGTAGLQGSVLTSTGTSTEWSATSSLGLGDGTLGGLTDVDTTNVEVGDLLKYTPGGWATTSTSTLGLPTGDTLITVAASDTPAEQRTNADYVADGSNDEVTIQAAIDEAYNGGDGGTVTLLSGTFNIDDQIHLATSSRLIGQGSSTVLYLVNSATLGNFEAMLLAHTAPYTYVGHLHLEGNQANNSSPNDGIEFTNTSSSTIEGVIVNDFGFYGFILNNSSNNTLTANVATNNDNRGFILNNSNNNTLTANTAVNNIDGFSFNSSSNNTLTGNTASHNSSGAGFNDLGGSVNNTLSANIAINNVDGFRVGNNDTLTANTATDNTNYGFNLNSRANNTLTGNTATNNSEGFRLSSSNHNTLTANTARDNNERGFLLNSSNNNTLTGNRAEGNGQNGIEIDDSTGTLLEGNYLFENGWGGATNYSLFIADDSDDTSIIDNTIVATGTAPLIFVESSDSERTTIAGNTLRNPDLDGSAYITDNGTDTRFDQYDRRTLTTDTQRGYSLLSITGSSSSSTISVSQQGSGDIFEFFDSAGSEVFTLLGNGNLGIGTSSPSSKLTITATGTDDIFTAHASSGENVLGKDIWRIS